MKHRPALSTLHISWVLLVALALLNGASLWGIFAARQGARKAAEHDLELRTTVLARTVEAELASLRADFLFLAQSPPVTGLVGSLDKLDPLQRRWRRIDAEGTFLLFLEAHPEIRRLEVQSAAGRILVVAGWQGTAQAIFSPNAGPRLSTSWIHGRWPLDQRAPAGAALAAWIDPDRLLSGVVPEPGSLDLAVAPATDPTSATRDGRLLASAPVNDSAWDPPVSWTLTAREEEGQLLRSVEALTGLYGTTVALNVAVMSLGLVLGLLAFRNLRRAATLEAERAQQEKVRELEHQLVHSERLASIGRLAAGLAHEINNPLEGVSNYLALLAEDLATGRLEDGQQTLALAREGVGRAADVIHQVLAFSDPARSGIAVVDLREVLSRSVDFFRRSPEHRDLAIDLSLPAEPLAIEGNPVTLGQVFLNLLLNASEAAPDAGSVAVTLEPEAGSAVVRVADRGAGIEPGDLDRIFEPFFSTRETTGLGLAVSRGIVDSHGGSLEAANRPGGGAELTVRLPLSPTLEETLP